MAGNGALSIETYEGDRVKWCLPCGRRPFVKTLNASPHHYSPTPAFPPKLSHPLPAKCGGQASHPLSEERMEGNRGSIRNPPPPRSNRDQITPVSWVGFQRRVLVPFWDHWPLWLGKPCVGCKRPAHDKPCKSQFRTAPLMLPPSDLSIPKSRKLETVAV